MRRICNRCLLLFVAAVGVLLGSVYPTSAQTLDVRHHDECGALFEQATNALAKANKATKSENEAEAKSYWERLVALDREYLCVCQDVMDRHGETSTLDHIGIGLNQLRKYGDALPILRRCTAIEPDDACCFVDMGESFEGLGQTQDAINANKQAIAIGGYNTLNALCIELAKKRLARLEGATGTPPSKPVITEGSGFFVNGKGYLLTNAHVVSKCKQIQIRDGEQLHLVNADEQIDLALLKEEIEWDDERRPVAMFRGSLPRVGDTVIVFGFPLPGLLSKKGNLSTGTIAARSGLRDDPRFIQITAPVQPGNSGGPVLDSSGDVIGVVVAKLDAIKMAQLTGDMPENVNFAIGVPEVIRFLKMNHVSPSVETRHSITELKTADVADRAQQFTEAIECTK